MCTYDHIDGPIRDTFNDLLRLCVGEEPRQHFHPDRVVGKTLGKRLVMLLGQKGGGGQDRRLLAVLHRLEYCANSNFGFAETHVAANQTVHRRRGLHIALHLLDRLRLIHGFDVREGLFHLPLPRRVLGKRMTGSGDASLVQNNEFLGNLGDR